MLPGVPWALPGKRPYAESFWGDAENRVALVHRWFAIQDLSPAGAQPMDSASNHCHR